MTHVERLIEFLSILNIGFPIKIGPDVYAMTPDDLIGVCTWDNGKPSDKVMTQNFSYNTLLKIPFEGLKEIHDANMFETVSCFTDPYNIPAYCVTTNGDVRADGTAIMAKGVALQVSQQFPGIDKTLGSFIQQYGNRVFNLGVHDVVDGDVIHKIRVISFPTKFHWRDMSDMTLISHSCEQLLKICEKFKIQTCFIPAPGCGLGGLNYDVTVKPLLDVMFDDRFYVCFN
jgi:hypothetical protein